MTRQQLDAMIRHLIDEGSRYTDNAQIGHANFEINLTTASVLAGIAGALIAARAVTHDVVANTPKE